LYSAAKCIFFYGGYGNYNIFVFFCYTKYEVFILGFIYDFLFDIMKRIIKEEDHELR